MHSKMYFKQQKMSGLFEGVESIYAFKNVFEIAKNLEILLLDFAGFWFCL